MDGFVVREGEASAFGTKTINFECQHCDYVYVTAATHALTEEERMGLSIHTRNHIVPNNQAQLNAIDYVNEPVRKLVNHVDYSRKAFDVVLRFMLLTTDELEALDDIIGGK